MKPTKILFWAAVAGAMIFAASKAAAVQVASSPKPFVISATIKAFGTNYFTGTGNSVEIQTITTKSFSTKDAFLLISNAVASTNNTTGHRTNFPAGSYLVFDQNRLNAYTNFEVAGEGSGTFYVTNRNGYYYQLDGYDAATNYYSFAELDSYSDGFGVIFNEVFSYKNNHNNNTGSETDFDTAIVYIHDNPYSFDIADHSSVVFVNNYAIVIGGILQIETKTGTTVTTYSASMSGTGNGEWKGDDVVVIKGKASVKGTGNNAS
jgi:hypothetical protein